MARNPASGGLAKIVITNSTSSNNGIIDKKYLAYADRDIKTIIDGIKSAINPNSYFSVKRKKIDQASGIFEVEVYVSASEAENAYKAGSYIMGKLNHRDEDADKDISYNVTKEEQTAYRAGVITLHGSKAQKIAREAVLPQGGMLIPPPAGSESDKWNYVIPVPEGSDSSYVGEMLHGARAESLTVVRNTALKESARDRESEKRKELANYKKYMSSIEAEQHKTGRMYANDVWDDFVQEETAKSKDDKVTDKVKNYALVKIVALLTSIGDITRRILSSVLEGASKFVTDTRKAGDVSLSLKKLQDFGVQERAFGLSSGTIMSAIGTIQSMFGNVSSLDENALEELALVMGGGVKDLILSGQGGKNPEALMYSIINAFSDKALSGYNSVGQYVGQEQARRELVGYLAKISPDLSELLSVFLEAKMNPNSIYGSANSYEAMQAMILTNRMNVTPVERDVSYTTGQYWDSVLASLQDIKNGIVVKLSAKLESSLEKIASSEAFQSDDTKVKTRAKNYEANLKTIESLDATINKIGSETVADTIDFSNYLSLVPYKDRGKIAQITKQEILDYLMTGKYNKQKYSRNDIETALKLAMLNHSFSEDLATLEGAQIKRKEAETANTKTKITPVFTSPSILLDTGYDAISDKLLPEGGLLWKEMPLWWKNRLNDYLRELKASSPDYYNKVKNDLIEANKKYGRSEYETYSSDAELFFKASHGAHPTRMDDRAWKEWEKLNKDGKGVIWTEEVETIVNSVMERLKTETLSPASPQAMLNVNITSDGNIVDTVSYKLGLGTLERTKGEDNINVDMATMFLG